MSKELSPELQAQIEQEAKEYASQFKYAYDFRKFGYQAGAAKYASKLHLLQQEVEHLQRWKEEAKVLLNPIFEYAQDHSDMKIGGSMTEFVLNRCKEYDKAKNLIKMVMDENEKWGTLSYELEKRLKILLDE